MSRCAGAGREHSKTDSPSWPMEIFQYHRCHAQFMNEGWLGDRDLSALLISVSWNLFLSGSSNFWGNFIKFMISGFHDHRWDWLQISHQVMGKTVLCIVCFAYPLLPLSLVVVVLLLLLSH